MARLILLNGPPGIGKSTIAQRYVDDHPLALDLEIDLVRSLLGGWLDQPDASGLFARRIAIGMARVALGEQHDVVVPQLLGRPEFIDGLADLAAGMGVPFHELVLLDAKPAARQRFLERPGQLHSGGRFDASQMVATAGGVDALDEMYDRLQVLLRTRPAAVVIEARAGQIDETYAEVVRSVTAPRA